MEVMKQLRQRAIRDLVDAAPDPDPAGARGSPARAWVPDDPGDDQPRRRRARADQGRRARARPRMPCRRASSRPRHRARTACASSCPTCRSRSTRPACCSSCARCPGSAHAIAAALDRARWPEVAGSIAGDDTLFVAHAGPGSLQRVKRRLLRLAEGGLNRLAPTRHRTPFDTHRGATTIRVRLGNFRRAATAANVPGVLSFIS